MAQPQKYDLEGWVRLYSRRLNFRCWRWPRQQPFYEIMSGALVWQDEIPWRVPMQIVWALRPVWAYRTGLILGESRPGRDYWELCRTLFPWWVGFHRVRCRPNRQYVAVYRVGNIGLIRCLKEPERADADDPQPGTSSGSDGGPSK